MSDTVTDCVHKSAALPRGVGLQYQVVSTIGQQYLIRQGDAVPDFVHQRAELLCWKGCQ